MPPEKERTSDDKRKTSKSHASKEQNVDSRHVKRIPKEKEATEHKKRKEENKPNADRVRDRSHARKQDETEKKTLSRRDPSLDKLNKTRSHPEVTPKRTSDSNNKTLSRSRQTRDDSRVNINKEREKTKPHSVERRNEKRDDSKVNRTKEKMKPPHSVERRSEKRDESKVIRSKERTKPSYSTEKTSEKRHRSSDVPPERKKIEAILTSKQPKKESYLDDEPKEKSQLNYPTKNVTNHKPPTKIAEAEDNYDDYEEDFEDYDSDFESEGEDPAEEENEDEELDESSPVENEEQKVVRPMTSTVPTARVAPLKAERSVSFDPVIVEKENILQAMKAENQFVEEFRQKDKAQTVDNKGAGNANESKPLTSNFINFSSAKQRMSTRRAVSKSVIRKMELFDSRRISMNEMHFDIFDLPPIDYEAYIKSFGRSNAKQIFCQTGDDDLTEEVQTDDFEITEKWTQHPALGRWCCGGNDVKNLDAEELGSLVKSDSVKLAKFIRTAGDVLVSIIEEEMNDNVGVNKQSNSKSGSSFSVDSSQLGELPFRKSCPVTFVQFSSDEPHLLLTIHAAAEDELVEALPELGIICLWNIFQPIFPQKILSSYSQPLCCCFNPGKAKLIFAGLADGSVLLWDLREPSSSHRKITYSGHDFVLRTSTYNTAEILRNESHRSPVIAIRSMQMESDFAVSSTDILEQQLTFRVASSEENGIIKLWTAVENAVSDISGSDSDLGLAPGSRIRLIRSQTIDLRQFVGLDMQTRKSLRSLDLQFLPNDCNHLFVATDLGAILHCDSNGVKVAPAIFKSDPDEVCEVRSLVFTDWVSPVCFIAGCSNGSIRLHSINKEKYILRWPDIAQESTVVSVAWAGNSSFFVLDSTSRLHRWDIHKNQINPTFSQKFEKHKVLHFHTNGSTDTSRKSFQIAVAFDDGSVEIHHVPVEASLAGIPPGLV